MMVGSSFKQTGLKGEAMDVISANSLSSVEWLQGSLIALKQQPLTWHKVNLRILDAFSMP